MNVILLLHATIKLNLNAELNRFFFWSDGCGSQFRSQFVFQSLCFYPANVNLSWDYGEAHHFKGPHDGIGGSLKQKVY